MPFIVLSGHKDHESVHKAVSLGAAAYVIKPFRATLLLQKVRKTLKLSSFRSRKVTTGEFGKTVLSIASEIQGVSEAGCLVECPARLAGGESISLVSTGLAELSLGSVLMRTVNQPEKPVSPGRYMNEVNFIGVDQDLAKEIRAKLAGSPRNDPL